MSVFDKVKDVTYVYSSEQLLRRGSNEMFVANIVKISTLNKDVLDSGILSSVCCRSWIRPRS